jgi:hypothetical protein
LVNCSSNITELKKEPFSEQQKIVFPEGINVIREVTDCPEFSNREIARIR